MREIFSYPQGAARKLYLMYCDEVATQRNERKYPQPFGIRPILRDHGVASDSEYRRGYAFVLAPCAAQRLTSIAAEDIIEMGSNPHLNNSIEDNIKMGSHTMRKFFASTLEIFEVAIIAIGAVFLIRSFLVQPFLVSGSSMVPNFSNGDYLLVDEITYRFRPPERGEVIVFKYPASPSTYFIKRIIGLPGEEVDIQDNKITIINKDNSPGLVLNEDYLPKSFYTAGSLKFKLKPDEYLMLGDNRSASFDSRNWGPLKTYYIVGLARIRLWPPTDFTSFAAPQY